MKKFITTKKVVTLTAMVVAATMLAAVPAFAATVNQVSIEGLNSFFYGDVPPPRMFSEGLDFTDDDARAVYDAEGRRVYLDTRREAIFSVGAGFVDSDGNAVPEYFVFGPAFYFPSHGNEFFFGPGEHVPGLSELRGRGPHGGYTTTSAKCAVCHSAHSSPAYSSDAIEGDAQGSSEGNNFLNVQGQSFLTRQGATNCEFCHLTGTPIGAAGMSTNIVYHGGNIDGTSDIGTDISGHSMWATAIPMSANAAGNEVSIPGGGLSCATCHAVHGNIGAWQPSEFFRGLAAGSEFEFAGLWENNETVTDYSYKMLRANPAATFNSASTPAAIESDNDNPVFARDTDQVNQYTLNTWCASCHNAAGLDKTMESVRPAGLENEAFEPLVTAFTVTDVDNIHDEAGGFAVGYDGAADPAAEPHSTTFVGIYSGPGQCYTCHRGDLGGWRTATWDVYGIESFEPLAGVDTYPNFDNLDRFRALGYFSLQTNTSDEQNRNLACSSCHFGTADYAFWAPQSDWPHRSQDYDIALLGLMSPWANLDNRGLAAGQTPVSPAAPDRADLPELFCARCHVNVSDDATEPNTFMISRHYIDHAIENDNSGELQAPTSPGN